MSETIAYSALQLPSRVSLSSSTGTRWFHRLLGWKGDSEIRLEIERQLRIRTHFPESEWMRAGFDCHQVFEVLALLQECMNWPNMYFIPNDPLSLLLVNDCVYPFGADDFVSDFRQKFGLPKSATIGDIGTLAELLHKVPRFFIK